MGGRVGRDQRRYTHYANTSVVESLLHISRGKVRFPQDQAAFHHYTIPGTADEYQASSTVCRNTDIANAALSSLVGADDYGEAWVRGFTHVQYLIPYAMGRDGGACSGWAGKARMPTESGLTNIDDADYPIVLWMRTLVRDTHTQAHRFELHYWMRSDFHEVGHNLGFRHSMTTTAEYAEKERGKPKPSLGHFLDFVSFDTRTPAPWGGTCRQANEIASATINVANIER